MLVRLIYASRAAEPITSDVVENILSTSREGNASIGITGVLCYSDEVFVQAIEGGREQVNRLYASLLRDPRHTDVTLLDYAEIESRRYPSWSMAKVRLEKLNLSLILKYSDKPKLDPFSVSGRATAAMLEELAATAVFCARD